VIAPISMDHTEFLGDTLTPIAGEKAAIIKRRRAGDLCRASRGGDGRDRERRSACARRCMRRAAMACQVERGRLVYQDDRGLMDLAAPKLFGRHQFDNAGLRSRPCAR
jgi:dihydrofolate synthase/folylpolyglutamate synthase